MSKRGKRNGSRRRASRDFEPDLLLPGETRPLGETGEIIAGSFLDKLHTTYGGVLANKPDALGRVGASRSQMEAVIRRAYLEN